MELLPTLAMIGKKVPSPMTTTLKTLGFIYYFNYINNSIQTRVERKEGGRSESKKALGLTAPYTSWVSDSSGGSSGQPTLFL